MNFGRSGWFKKYIEFRLENPLPAALPSFGVRIVDTGVHNDMEQAIYYFLQPTGLLYGSLAASPFPDVTYPQEKYFHSGDRLHMSFLDSLFACMVADRHFMLDGLVDEADRLQPAAAVAMGYFLEDPHLLPALIPAGEGGKPFSLDGETQGKAFEKLLTRRVTGGAGSIFRRGLLHNGFLFLDLYGCLLWQRHIVMEPETAGEALEKSRQDQQEWREALIRLVICTSHADGFIEPLEQRLIEHLLKSSGLPGGVQTQLRGEMRGQISVADLEVPEAPWIVRRYFLELVLMAALADRAMAPDESAFVEQLVEKLGLWDEEMHQSQAALELFLIQNRDTPVSPKGSSIFRVQQRIQERAGLALRKNLDNLVNEIRETRELYTLLMKSTKESLSAEEKRKVHDQLMDIMKTIPALAIFALPGGGIILPVMIKLLPFNLLPSSFDD